MARRGNPVPRSVLPHLSLLPNHGAGGATLPLQGLRANQKPPHLNGEVPRWGGGAPHSALPPSSLHPNHGAACRVVN